MPRPRRFVRGCRYLGVRGPACMEWWLCPHLLKSRKIVMSFSRYNEYKTFRNTHVSVTPSSTIEESSATSYSVHNSWGPKQVS